VKGQMTAAVLYGKEDVKIERVPIPRVGDGEVLIKVQVALTCGTDLKVYARGNIWDMERLETFVKAVESVDPRVTGHRNVPRRVARELGRWVEDRHHQVAVERPMVHRSAQNDGRGRWDGWTGQVQTETS